MRHVAKSELGGALAARDLASALYLLSPRVSFIDVGWRIKNGQPTDELAVRFHVHRKPQLEAYEMFAANTPELVIDKGRIPYLVDIVEGSYPLSYDWGWGSDGGTADVRTQVCNPLRGGISISNEWFYGYGTLGGMVEDCDTGQAMLLSNWHVLVGMAYAPPGLRIYQPGAGDGGTQAATVARVTRDAMLSGVDAAVATVTRARTWINDQLDVGAVTGVTAPVLGMAVEKSGRASGVTVGYVDGVEGEYPIEYGGLTRSIKHVCLIVPAIAGGEVSRPGDSGSWWLEQGTRRAVGLHFAGGNDPETALALRMSHVLEALNVRLAGLAGRAVSNHRVAVTVV
jgi:endonuclease G, mitochondrial